MSGTANVKARFDDEQRDRAAAEDVRLLALEHDRGAEDPEDRTGRADGEPSAGSKSSAPAEPGEARDEVEQEVPHRAERSPRAAGRSTRASSMFMARWIGP